MAAVPFTPDAAPALPPQGRLEAIAESSAPQMCEWVGLKWLMGACGRQVDVDRLLADRAYALDCLDAARDLGNPQVAVYATTLQRRLDPGR